MNITFVRLLVFILAPLSLQAAEKPWIPFKGTESPDGNYILAWGFSEYEPMKTSAPEKLRENFEAEKVKNFIVEVNSGQIVATLPSRYFALEDFAENHGALNTSWRKDSQAVAVLYDGKWEARDLFISYLNLEREMATFDTYQIKGAINAATRKQYQKYLPTPDFGVITYYDLSWVTEDQISLSFEIYQPKSEGDEGIDGTITVKVPTPADVKIID